ncbi:MAG TPA: (d)CMP kinase [Chloroflexota bacterium]|nr:(d)CMP kinase [Chloroflexota bacterium]
MPPSVIAIDGPAGSGKSVVGQRVADALGYVYLDTGALYRALTWLALEREVDPNDSVRLADLARRATIQVTRPTIDDGRLYTVTVDGQDVTRQLSDSRVGELVSIVAAHPEVRAELLPLQRRLACDGNIVMAGRDIGTVVCPAAELKLYLDAPLAIRVARRVKQLVAMGREPDPALVAAEMGERDRIDESRAAAPLKPAPDAHVIDTSILTMDEEVALILDLLSRGCS